MASSLESEAQECNLRKAMACRNDQPAELDKALATKAWAHMSKFEIQIEHMLPEKCGHPHAVASNRTNAGKHI